MERADEHLECPYCHFCVYPHPSPCTAIFITNSKQQILLARRAIEPKKGFFDAVGGFVQTGESFEEGALREVKEETGLDVVIQSCLGSVSDHYFETPTITVGYLAKPIKGTPQPADDVAQLHWLDLDHLPPANKIAFKSFFVLLSRAIKLISVR